MVEDGMWFVAQSIRDLADRYWELTLAASPMSATMLGIHRWDDQIEDLSEEAEAELGSRLVDLSDELQAVPVAGLTAADRITRSLLEHQLTVGIEATSLRLVELASDQMLGPHAALLMMAPQLTYPEVEFAESALRRYEKVPAMLDQALERFRAGARIGRTPASAVIARSIHSLSSYLATPIESDPFPAAGLPDGWSGEGEWRSRVQELVRTQIRPAFERYLGVLRDELAPLGRPDDKAGWCWLPDGDALYGALVRAHTTLTLSPVALHELGVRHTEELLPMEYADVAGRAFGMTERKEIFEKLRTDPSLRHRDGAEILSRGGGHGGPGHGRHRRLVRPTPVGALSGVAGARLPGRRRSVRLLLPAGDGRLAAGHVLHQHL